MTTKQSFMLRLRRMVAQRDQGSALVMTMLVLAVMTGLATTVFVLSSRNLKNAARDRQATAALADSEAGIGQAVAYIRSVGLKPLACAPNCNAANPWGEQPASVDGDPYPSQQVTLATGDTYQVWIEPVQPFIPGRQEGRYRVHSIGSANGTGTRTVVEDVVITPFSFPIAVYGDQINAGGGGKILTESLFTSGCVFKRSRLNFQGVDPVYGIPAAAHSNSIITDDQVPGNGSGCPTTSGRNEHISGPCNTSYPFDQDAQGGSLSGTSCYQLGATMAGSDPTYAKTSYMSDVAKTYGFSQSGLTSAELDMLRTSAQQQGFYFTDTSQIPAVLQANATAKNYPNPVLFYDLKGAAVGGSVNLGQLDATTYGRPSPLSSTDSACSTVNFILVVVNGNVQLQSNATLVGSIFAMGPSPYGQILKSNGTANLIGTMYGRSIDMTGTVNVNLDDCFLANLPGNLLNVRPTNFREVDR